MKAKPFFLAFALIAHVAASHAQNRSTVSDSPRPTSADRSRFVVTHADVRLYPALALAAKLSGVIRVRVVVKSGIVSATDVQSTAPPVLIHASTENIKTWRFSPDSDGSFDVTYVYELAKDESVVFENPTLRWISRH